MNVVRLGLAALSIVSLSSVALAEPEARLPENVAPVTGSEPDDPNTETIACPYVRGELVKLGYSATGSVNKPWQIFTAASGLTCLQKSIIDPIMNHPDAEVFDKGDGYWDDTIAFLFAEKYFPQVSSSNLGKNVEGDEIRTTYSAKGSECRRESFYHVTFGGKPQQCSEGTVVFNNKCQPVSVLKAAEECGGRDEIKVAFELDFLRSSPISFLWDDSTDIEENISVVSFPIDPTYQNAWYTWKGSDKAPLLVHNPSHDGVITSGNQLFGPWTFGGKRTAMAGDKAIIGQPWRDGYEALGTLDRNGDGELAGEELKPLALWFDKNQDAVSQPGEVKQLDEVGVEKVFYKSNRVDGVTGNIFADRGFVRVENGRRISGGSVDWFADTAGAPGDLINKHVISALNTTGLPAAEIPALPPEERPASELAAPNTKRDPLVGVWQWSYSEQPGAGIQGYLLLGANAVERKVRGYSLVGNRFAYVPNDFASEIVNFYAVQGEFEPGEKGTRLVKFSSQSGGAKLRTVAELSADGKMMNATTTAYVEKDRKYHKMTYRWTALKISGS